MKSLLTLLILGLIQWAPAAEDPKLLDPSILPPLWEKETIAAWEKLPIRDGGRIKPLYTFAKYELVRTRGLETLRLKLKSPDPATGKMYRSLSAIEWVMDCMFHPEAAKQYPCFTVDDGEALVRVGLKPHPAKRDQYSYNELIQARDRLAQMQEDVDAKKQEATRTNSKANVDYLDEMAANLARNIGAYETLLQALAPLRRALPVVKTLPDGPLSESRGLTISTSKAVAHLRENALWKDLMDRLAQQSGGKSADASDEAMMTVVGMLKQSKAWETHGPRSFLEMGQFAPALEAWMTENAETLKERPGLASIANLSPFMMLDMRGGSRVAFIPPLGGGSVTWHHVGDLPKLGLTDGPESAKAMELLKVGEEAVAFTDSKTFQNSLRNFAGAIQNASTGTPAVATVYSELLFRKADLLVNAKILFIIAFILIAICWLAPVAKWSNALFIIAKILVWAALLAITASIIWRLFIGTWAPVTNLYETIPLITLVAAGLAVFAEKLLRNKMSLGLGAFLGAAGLYLAGAFEASEASDTIKSLEAVLRSGFWLWTHVMCEVIAYGSCIVGGCFSIVYIFARLFDLERRKAEYFKMLTTCAYGILCFTLFFILVGTVLGGIWGNYSWGRFWGWDPKENGALVITLWCLIVLHMRLAGWIKEFGVHLMNIFGINAVIFSWWHVNEIGVGLHAYGRTEGRLKWIIIGYVVVTLVVLFGAIISSLARNKMKSRGQKPAESLC